MNKQQTPRVSLEMSQPMRILSINLRLLELDQQSDWPGNCLQSLDGRDDVHSQKTWVQIAEWILYRLYQLWNPDDARNKLQPFFPPLEPLQSINLRAALFRCLNELKKNGTLSKEIILRKSMFDDCKGEKFRDLLSAFSTVVVRKSLAASNEGGFNGIAGQLSLSDNVPRKYSRSLLPLAIAHKASLAALLRRKEDFKSYYHDFNCALKQKDQDLQRKFERIMENQDLLDKNGPSEDTVERVAKVLDQHWLGDRALVGTIAEGEEMGLQDSLLDQQFSRVWTSVVEGEFNGDIGTSRHGLLEDLERRTAIQRSRLQQWKKFKIELSQDMASSKAETKEVSSTHLARSPQAKTPRIKTSVGKNLVFSPRKSPRKSMWPIAVAEDTPHLARKSDKTSHSMLDASRAVAPSRGDTPGDLAQTNYCGGRHVDSEDDSGFSEETAGWHMVQEDDRTDGGAGSETKPASRKQSPSPTKSSSSAKETGSATETRLSRSTDCQKPGATDGFELAQRLDTLNINAVLDSTPKKLSLVERTRQSMAIASPERASNDASIIQAPNLTYQIPPSPEQTAVRANLAERTRQSISLVSTQPKPKLTHNRGIPKLYPTNQFETPRRQNTVRKLTPPEELFSPGAGYDSVFKSRPKIAYSPATSPVPSDGETMDRQWADSEKVSLDDSSPLARLVAKT